MPQSTSAILAARRIAGRAPDQAISSPRNLGVTFALIMTLSAGCQLEVGGISAQATGPGVGGASSTSSRTTGTSSGGGESMSGGGMSVGSMSSGGNPSSSASGNCTATGAEVCYDGVDNDCDGAIDCADTECPPMGFTCVPAIPSGWKSVAFSPMGNPGCPSGYTPVDVASMTSTDFNCACNCMLTSPPTCTQGTVTIESNGADPCPTDATIKLAGNGGLCTVTNRNTEKKGLAKVDPIPATQGTCSATPARSVQPIGQGRACMAPAVGAGCAGEGACVARPQAPLASCIAHDGALSSCPMGYPTHYAVGTAPQDTRSCTPCSCGATAICANAKLTLYTDAACLVGSHELPATGTCDPVNDGNGQHYGSYRYTATVTSASCQTTQNTTKTGSLNLTGERTICCQ